MSHIKSLDKWFWVCVSTVFLIGCDLSRVPIIPIIVVMDGKRLNKALIQRKDKLPLNLVTSSWRTNRERNVVKQWTQTCRVSGNLEFQLNSQLSVLFLIPTNSPEHFCLRNSTVGGILHFIPAGSQTQWVSYMFCMEKNKLISPCVSDLIDKDRKASTLRIPSSEQEVPFLSSQQSRVSKQQYPLSCHSPTSYFTAPGI